ncbi:hypothetical protein, partial [Chamaesiphon sp.]|uniref:hypothetical protein n=1 Tax=Chamaesiphon sp. TaxID=2814140 RepID=UPI003593F650
YDFWKSNNRPSILFYQSNKLINPATIDSDQYQKVREFFNQFKPDGKNPGLYYRYETELDFEKKLRIDLTRFIAERVKKNLLLK